MINETLFEILVYSCNQDAFLEHVTADVHKQLLRYPFGPLCLVRATDPVQQQRDEDLRKEMQEKEIERRLKPVRYNELVGCIEVHSVVTQLRADYWFSEKERIVVGGKTRGTIRWQGKLLEREYDGSLQTSSDIFKDFRGHLVRAIKGDRRLSRRHIDFEAFDRCGPFVDWRAALGL
jgi:hypothetical protein